MSPATSHTLVYTVRSHCAHLKDFVQRKNAIKSDLTVCPSQTGHTGSDLPVKIKTNCTRHADPSVALPGALTAAACCTCFILLHAYYPTIAAGRALATNNEAQHRSVACHVHIMFLYTTCETSRPRACAAYMEKMSKCI